MTIKDNNTLDSYSKKELVVNSWLLSENLSISEIADAVDCSYEYARRIIRQIESGDLLAEDFADDELQSELRKSLDLSEMNHSVSDYNQTENQNKATAVPTGNSDSIKNIDLSLEKSEDEDSSKTEKELKGGETEGVLAEDLKEALTKFEELRNEAKFHLDENEGWAYGQYYVAQRAVKLVEGLLDSGETDVIAPIEIWELVRIFEEFYHEAEFEKDVGLVGAEQKRYTAYRIASVLNSALQEGDD